MLTQDVIGVILRRRWLTARWRAAKARLVTQSFARRIPLERLRAATGSQLLEFALGLPFLVVMVVGVIDFGEAYNLKQKLNNAAREGARIAASSPTADLNCGGCSTTPNSVTAIRDAVANYLTNANVSYCTIGTSATYAAANQTWTYPLSGSGCSGGSLTIERGYLFNSGSGPVSASQVSLNYPYTWTFGRVIALLVGSSGPTSITISSNAVMQNL